MVPPDLDQSAASTFVPSFAKPSGFVVPPPMSSSDILFACLQSFTAVCRSWCQISSQICSIVSAPINSSMFFVEPPIVGAQAKFVGASSALVCSCFLPSTSVCGWVCKDVVEPVLLDSRIFVLFSIISVDLGSCNESLADLVLSLR
ncbi:unnamed protein product [Arabis nemorensis]|uniref:Uncharacterized protein n=1 Tax=Arabis nemorensis TaxID=586526 RepID=A0A565AU33_9BRAS|nr:unnamed protein product [Arabis nemorensis]